MDVISSYDDMVRLFSESGLMHQAEPEQRLVKLPTRMGPMEGVMFIRWEAQQQVVHFIQTLDIEIPTERMSALALAVAIFNHALALPGFGINVGVRNCYFRITMPMRPDGTLTKTEIQGLFNLAVRTAAEQYTALRDVALNDADPMQLLPAAG